MVKIRPVSELRNYNEILRDIETGSPVFLTKNGKGRYVILDIADYHGPAAPTETLPEDLLREKRLAALERITGILSDSAMTLEEAREERLHRQ
jgi:prevent-host-death family protein